MSTRQEEFLAARSSRATHRRFSTTRHARCLRAMAGSSPPETKRVRQLDQLTRYRESTSRRTEDGLTAQKCLRRLVGIMPFYAGNEAVDRQSNEYLIDLWRTRPYVTVRH